MHRVLNSTSNFTPLDTPVPTESSLDQLALSSSELDMLHKRKQYSSCGDKGQQPAFLSIAWQRSSIAPLDLPVPAPRDLEKAPSIHQWSSIPNWVCSAKQSKETSTPFSRLAAYGPARREHRWKDAARQGSACHSPAEKRITGLRGGMIARSCATDA